MGISAAISFQENLQKSFENSPRLKSLVKEIHTSLKPASKYPYIYHHINNSKLISTGEIWEIDGEINIYIKDSNHKNFSPIILELEQIFSSHAELISVYKFISGKILSSEFLVSHDALTSRMKMTYKVTLKGNK